MTTSVPEGAHRRASHRYGLLLGLIVVSLSFQLAAPAEDWARLVTVVLQGATLLLALWTSEARPLILRLAAAVVAAALVTSLAGVLTDFDTDGDSITLVNLLLVGIAPIAIGMGVVRRFRTDRTVTLATMFGVLCIYLLLGMFFAFIYGAINAFSSDGVFAERVDATQADFLYFSFSTLTTTGYGDLTAATGLGRAVAISEALVGQVYLVTIVAAIVSNLRPRSA
jgi:hypothetical protein